MNCKNMGCINLFLDLPPTPIYFFSTPHPHDLNNNWIEKLLRNKKPVARYRGFHKCTIIYDESKFVNELLIRKVK